MSILKALWILALPGVFTACSTRVEVSDRFPTRIAGEWSDKGRERPEERYRAFEVRYRALEPCQYRVPGSGEFVNRGCSPVIYPQSVQQGAPWEYVLLGRDYVAAHDDGAAARSYWSALTLSAKTVTSRPEKEEVRRAAYLGLAEVAERRSQRHWAELMRFCASLPRVYLDTDQAREDDRAFFAEMDQIKQANADIERAQQAAANAQALGMLGAMNSINAGAAATAAHNMPAAMQYNTQGVLQVMQATAEHNQAMDAINDASERHSGQSQHFVAVVAEDVPEIEAGNSFLAEEGVFYVASAVDPKPYLDAITAFAVNKPGLQKALASDACRGTQTKADPNCLLQIRDALRDIEIFVAKNERRGKLPPAEAAQATWHE